ncbi:MAG: hypothetical protein ACYDB2_12275 [Acidimicrobiales bacterium]
MASTGPDIYTDFIKTLTDAEAARKTSIEAKGTGIITTSSALVTILFGLVAVVTSRTTFLLPVAAHGWMVSAILAFVVAAATAILINFPLPYGQTTITLDELREWWGDTDAVADAAVSGLRLQQLNAARRVNALKAGILAVACTAELAGIALLTVAVIKIVTS